MNPKQTTEIYKYYVLDRGLGVWAIYRCINDNRPLLAHGTCEVQCATLASPQWQHVDDLSEIATEQRNGWFSESNQISEQEASLLVSQWRDFDKE